MTTSTNPFSGIYYPGPYSTISAALSGVAYPSPEPEIELSTC